MTQSKVNKQTNKNPKTPETNHKDKQIYELSGKNKTKKNQQTKTCHVHAQ